MLKLTFLVITTLTSFICFSQSEIPHSSNTPDHPVWIKEMYSPQADPGIVKKAFEEYYKENNFVKNTHTQYYKRWMREISRNYVPENPQDKSEFMKSSSLYLDNCTNLKNVRSTGGNWQCIGPFDFDQGSVNRSYAAGAAHVYTVEMSLSDSTVLYAGTATAGVWKSMDHGENWTALTNDMLATSVRALEIDHDNSDQVWFASNGYVFGSSDGGMSWDTLGGSSFNIQTHSVNDMVMRPDSLKTLYFAMEEGLFVSYDMGATITLIMPGVFQEIEFHPTNPDVMYFVRQLGEGTVFYRSDDAGNTLVIKNNGWPTPAAGEEQKRVEIAVTIAAPDAVYALATGVANGGSGLYGVYSSSDSANTWTFMCCGPQPGGVPSSTNMNLMGWDGDGTDDGGQYYYDLAFDVSPIDPLELHVGAVNHWISYDGGSSFTCPATWSQSDKVNYVHADIHDIRFFGNELWIAGDGGIFTSSDFGATINRKMLGIAGTDFWGFGASFQTADVMLGGTYHNGTLLMDGDAYINDWVSTDGGDNIRGYVSFGDDRICYSDYGGKILSGDRNTPNTWFAFDSLPNASYITGASSEMVFDPRNYNHIWVGKDNNLLKTENNGATFTTVFAFDDEVTSMEVARTDPDYIYVCTSESWWGAKKIWRSTDGGANWSNITPNSVIIANDRWVPYDIAVSSTNKESIWLARTSPYGDSPNMNGKMVFHSSNGGTSWQNITTPTLSGEFPTHIIHQRGSEEGVYLGTNRSVYYMDNTMSDWQLFNNGLPFYTYSVKLVPYYGENKIRNGTSRSVWESPMFSPSMPQAQIAANKFNVSCFDQTVQFVDHSVAQDSTAVRQWTFSGGNPSTSTLRNPIVTYSSPGQYDVTLTITDAYGTDTQSYTGFITYDDNISSQGIQEDFETGFGASWVLRNLEETFNWGTIDVFYGPECSPTRCTYVNHYDINAPGDEAELITPIIDLTSVSNANLYLDYAYAEYGPPYTDGFRIDVSEDCGQTWDSIWGAFGDVLQTVSDQGNWWEPTDCNDWVNMSFDLSSYKNKQIMIRFVAINGFGNNFYLDNINIEGIIDEVVEPVNDKFEFNIVPNPNIGVFSIESSQHIEHITIMDLTGKLVYETTSKSILLENLAPGIYSIVVRSGSQVHKKNMAVGF